MKACHEAGSRTSVAHGLPSSRALAGLTAGIKPTSHTLPKGDPCRAARPRSGARNGLDGRLPHPLALCNGTGRPLQLIMHGLHPPELGKAAMLAAPLHPGNPVVGTTVDSHTGGN